MGSKLNTFINDYMWPIFMVIILIVVLGMVVKNMKSLFGQDGESKKEALMDVAMIVLYVVVALAAVGGVLTLMSGSKPNINF